MIRLRKRDPRTSKGSYNPPGWDVVEAGADRVIALIARNPFREPHDWDVIEPGPGLFRRLSPRGYATVAEAWRWAQTGLQDSAGAAQESGEDS